MAITDGGPTMTMPVAPTGMMGGGFGGENGWWVILFIILMFGWGRNGYGNNNGSVMDGYVLTSDFASVERKLDTVNNGICDSTFALNNSINGGFATAELSRANQQAALMQQLNAMQMQAAECCCNTQRSIEGVRYEMAAQACDTRNTVQTAARDIVENANANSRAILDFLTQSKLQDLQSANQELRLQASQAAQNNYLISQLRPTPIPSYPSCNPWASGSYTGCCGC